MLCALSIIGQIYFDLGLDNTMCFDHVFVRFFFQMQCFFLILEHLPTNRLPFPPEELASYCSQSGRVSHYSPLGGIQFGFVTVEVSGVIHSTGPKDLVTGIISAQRI